MARSAVSSVMVLGFLVVAAFCVAEASATSRGGNGGKPNAVRIILNNECSSLVTLEVGVGSVQCQKGKQAVLNVNAVVGNLVKVDVYVLDSKGKLVKLEAIINLSKLGKLVEDLLEDLLEDVLEVVLDVVVEVVAGVEGKSLKLICGKTLLAVALNVNL